MRSVTTTPVWLLAAALWAAPAPASEIFVYETGDGSRLITDHPRMEQGYRLIRVYSQSKVYRQAGGQRRPAITPRPSDYDELIASVGHRASLDPLLIKSVMHAESAFDPNAVSGKGASGLMQLMPDTARRYGVSRIFDPHDNIMGGARYLSDLLDLFNGDLKLALAGYNAGENAVIERGGIPPYDETRRYVSKVMRLYRDYQSGRCEQHRDSIAAVEGTVVSCSASTRRSPMGNTDASARSNVNISSVSTRDTVSSADERGWRITE